MHRRKYNRRYYRISPICVGVDRESYDADNLVKAASTGVVYSSQSPTAGYDTYLRRGLIIVFHIVTGVIDVIYA
jgi:hypothetical protein